MEIRIERALNIEAILNLKRHEFLESAEQYSPKKCIPIEKRDIRSPDFLVRNSNVLDAVVLFRIPR